MSTDPRTTFYIALLESDKPRVICGARIRKISATSFLDVASQLGDTAKRLGVSTHPKTSVDWVPLQKFSKSTLMEVS